MNNLAHLIGLKDLSKQQLVQLLDRAQYWAARPSEQADILRGRFVANLFFEASTRTRFSFEVAQKRLGAHVLNFIPETSSTVKGETVYDTIRTLEAMGVEAAVIRTKKEGLLQELAQTVDMKLVNAGDGTNEHPTQCLLDLLTMKQQFGMLEGLTVAIIGDLRHSRVLGSHLHAMPKLGINLLLAGPPAMMPADIPQGVKVVSMEEAIQTSDVVMMLRVQLERHTESLYTSKEEYHKAFGLTLERATMMKQGAVIMHPAPVNRGVEIHTDLVECETSLIQKQVTNGVAARMAVLETLLKGSDTKWEPSLATATY
ncbi:MULTISPECIES: aspartate carbamoyltransferase catalytic subunit [Brevibacillus]|uniref:Aspartate carbamoyltransferase n=1 Tax=Brevibacillus parabrevis TaxID=54914 RepID=A0A4Y3PIA1_BREPA|nr:MULTISPECIES: aspartate carbamoyltransferase catalytic subunit [Brevibacillus]MBU8711611.1 aspartate carbamoyltransferase catalytic subunit [Brevibacillus parabrevis]RNB94104.1 aspartate carbamoyltransferase catalytic subunit [Brevibacillus parabrevis]UED67173.1 aspartate carbamoyltransferase catalytic subunit [Brevibacillus sp. HD3.3A]WDV93432.1 aspartate carbamoyltransferase catalytic subunit [Brevibacillus parabrevis]GEB33017.1 aspartate carbamoyltransferase [Brevibacillus parabrevis]